MGNYTREEILQMAEEEDVEFIRLQFTDMFGTLKNIAITARELPRALDNRCIVDGSFIAGIAGESEPDMYLRPDLDTFAILPWRPQQGKVARLLCDIYCPDGTPHERSPRYILKKTAREAKKEGYTCLVDPECEFFLFHTDDNGVPTTVTHEKAGYLDVSPVDLGENARRDIVLNLEDMGIEVESSHHETAPAQHEVDFKYGEVRTIADRIMSFKMTVRTIAKRHGLHATFMPKPRAEVNGSGMHIHFSLFKDGRNVFVNPGNPQELSEKAYYFVGGLLAHSKEMALITNPIVNSYKRLTPGYGAPIYVAWSTKNRSPLIRIPLTGDGIMAIELRCPDSAANPYLALAVCMAAGLDGIKQKIVPPSPVDRNISDLTEEERNAMQITLLPGSLGEAVAELKKDDFLCQVLGQEFVDGYINAKEEEWHEYLRQVSDWETEKYLYRI